MRTISQKQVKARKQHVCDWCCQKIEIGQTYTSSFLVADDPYTWKNHISCEEIATHLELFENYDEGLTSEGFIEDIEIEYQNIMSNSFNELYESKDFVYPSFKDQLQFVINHHLKAA